MRGIRMGTNYTGGEVEEKKKKRRSNSWSNGLGLGSGMMGESGGDKKVEECETGEVLEVIRLS